MSHCSSFPSPSTYCSKLTLHRDCCLAVLHSPPFLPLLLQSLTVHHSHPVSSLSLSLLPSLLSLLTLSPSSFPPFLSLSLPSCLPPSLPLLLQDILVRVCFILGNLTAEKGDARRELVSTHQALTPLTSLITASVATEIAEVSSVGRPISLFRHWPHIYHDIHSCNRSVLVHRLSLHTCTCRYIPHTPIYATSM